MIDITLKISEAALQRACNALERPVAVAAEDHIRGCLRRLLNEAVYQAEKAVWAKSAEQNYNQSYILVTEAKDAE